MTKEKLITELEGLLLELNTAWEDYTTSEGCGCCSDYEEHNESCNRIYSILEKLNDLL